MKKNLAIFITTTAIIGIITPNLALGEQITMYIDKTCGVHTATLKVKAVMNSQILYLPVSKDRSVSFNSKFVPRGTPLFVICPAGENHSECLGRSIPAQNQGVLPVVCAVQEHPMLIEQVG